MAQVEGTAIVSELLRLAIIDVTFSRKSFVSKKALFFSADQCCFLNLLLQAEQWSKFLCNGARNVFGHFNLMLAAWARHEGEGNAKGCPPVLQELNHAVSVESVATGEPGAGF